MAAHRFLEGVALPQEAVDVRQQGLALRRQGNAAAAAAQQGVADLLLQTVEHAGKSGLGIAQPRGGAGDTAGVRGGPQCPQLFDIHRITPTVCILNNSFIA